MSKTKSTRGAVSAVDIAAWGEFWADGARAEGGGCLPDGAQVVERAQQRTWTEFAERIPGKARILDIATGDGRVMAWLKSVRPNARLVGVDRAASLPKPPAGTKIKAGVVMEQLPFADGSFQVVVSQFGFEYGDIVAAAREAARVLQPGGWLALMTHRADGPILAHNTARREQMVWVLDEQELPALAKRSLAMRAAGVQTVPPKIAAAPTDAARRFGQGSVAWEISEAIRQSLELGRKDAPANVAALIDSITAKARNEMGRIDSLARACAVTDDELAFEAVLADAGLIIDSTQAVIADQNENPIADFRILRLPVK